MKSKEKRKSVSIAGRPVQSYTASECKQEAEALTHSNYL